MPVVTQAKIVVPPGTPIVTSIENVRRNHHYSDSSSERVMNNSGAVKRRTTIANIIDFDHPLKFPLWRSECYMLGNSSVKISNGAFVYSSLDENVNNPNGSGIQFHNTLDGAKNYIGLSEGPFDSD